MKLHASRKPWVLSLFQIKLGVIVCALILARWRRYKDQDVKVILSLAT